MILDLNLKLFASKALSGTGAVGDNVIDLGVARSLGGEPMSVLFICEVAADQTTGDEDYTFVVEYASAAAQNAGVKEIGKRKFESGTPAAPAEDADLLVAGFAFSIPIPGVTQSEDERYIGVRAVLEGTTPTITVSAYLVPSNMMDKYKAIYASGFSIA